MRQPAPARRGGHVRRPQCSTGLLLPEGWAGTCLTSLGCSCLGVRFEGWALQPSPCCAAASVAGACNAVLGLVYDDPVALTTHHVAGLLHSMLAEQAAKWQESAARLLGVPTIEPALAALRAELAAEGRSLGGRKEKACKAKDALERLGTICQRRAPSQQQQPAR